MSKVRDLGELELIKEFSRHYRISSRTLLGIGDDAALLKVAKNKLQVLTTDCLIEGVHFTCREASPSEIGWKAIGSSLSDLAAMAALPRAAVISLGLPADISVAFVKGLTRGMEKIARCFNLDIVGGDTVRSPGRIFISVTILGETVQTKSCRRGGARIGDRILVTGRLGGSRARKQYKFQPRLKEAQWLVKRARIHSMIDVTDGLALDLFRIIKASKVGAKLFEQALPLSWAALKSGRGSVAAALEDGEDFELLFTVSSTAAPKLVNKWNFRGVPLTVIGEIVPVRHNLVIVDRQGRERKLVPKGYRAF